MWLSDGWTDFEILDCSGGERLERWGKYLLVRPDPQVIWETARRRDLWDRADARYIRSSSGGGRWEFFSKLPDSWRVSYRGMTFAIKPMGFKHTGLFPEQAANWDFLSETIKNAGRPVSAMNLFAYTGAATVAMARAGAAVCHVDAARGMVAWARENAELSGVSSAPVRYIVDDCVKFAERELRRGRRYDGIVMDPPSYGRGPAGEIWKLEERLYHLVGLCAELLSERPLFFVLNSYTAGLSPSVMSYMLGITVGRRFGGRVQAEELGLLVRESGLAVPCGATARWTPV